MTVKTKKQKWITPTGLKLYSFPSLNAALKRRSSTDMEGISADSVVVQFGLREKPVIQEILRSAWTFTR